MRVDGLFPREAGPLAVVLPAKRRWVPIATRASSGFKSMGAEKRSRQTVNTLVDMFQ